MRILLAMTRRLSRSRGRHGDPAQWNPASFVEIRERKTKARLALE
jgi:hypothetical protein